MLDGNLSSILLAKKGPNGRALLLPCRVPGDVVGDSEEHEGVELDMKP